MKTYKYPTRENWSEILKRPTLDLSDLEPLVNDILNQVKTEGDEAIQRFTKKFDNVQITDFEVSKSEIEAAESQVSNELKIAIQTAKANITTFHAAQKSETLEVETMPGVKCWRKSIAIQKVGLYIPGGTAPLFSTVLMLAVPANLAGCKEIVLCAPPQKDGKIHPAVLYTANLCGVSKIYKIGGVQAIGAMAFGTETVPKVQKIFGPGNQFVTVAKQLISKSGIAIDMPAGPSEVLVVADETANPAFVAADLLSQAEHGEDSQVVLVAFEADFINNVQTEINKQLANLPRQAIAKKSLENSVSIIAKSREEAIDITNEYAPEHLIIAVKNALDFTNEIINAGSIFIGNYTPEAVGDYASGTNHTLPTNGFATAFSGVSVDAFVKKITYQEITKIGIQNIGKTVELMAEAEELMGHKMAVTIRLQQLKL
ncbi:MAG: histidinol dehydrogenase [Saprospiraceae bacterium]|jgi:histidinol dehydrogenase